MAVATGVIALFFWSPWVKPTEVEWLVTYEAWSDGLDASLAAGREVSRASCESRFDDEVGDPPSKRLQPMAAAARRGCSAATPAGWKSSESDVVRALMSAHGELLPPRARSDVSAIASSSLGVRPDVYCWPPESWATFAEHYAIVRGGEEASLKGITDRARNRVDLDPGVCAALGRYLRRIRPSALTYQNYELAEALVVLTHNVEHLKTPSATEVEVECYAVQHVRPLIRAAGWGPKFATEIALHAWEIGYSRLPRQFRTPACRNGGPLDRNPTFDEWP